MNYIAGVDIGNSTTEVCIAALENGRLHFLGSASKMTTGTKGTQANVAGILAALKEACEKLNMSAGDISLIRINEAAPVIGDTAMETITETIITESSMIGHNPSTPAGAGQAVGRTISLGHLKQGNSYTPYIVMADKSHSYEEVADTLNRYGRNSFALTKTTMPGIWFLDFGVKQ